MVQRYEMDTHLPLQLARPRPRASRASHAHTTGPRTLGARRVLLAGVQMSALRGRSTPDHVTATAPTDPPCDHTAFPLAALEADGSGFVTQRQVARFGVSLRPGLVPRGCWDHCVSSVRGSVSADPAHQDFGVRLVGGGVVVQKPRPFQNEEQHEDYTLWWVRRAHAEPGRASRAQAQRQRREAGAAPSPRCAPPWGVGGRGAGSREESGDRIWP